MENVKREIIDNEVEYSFYSEAGEDFVFYVPVESELKDVRAYAENFDVDEHVEMWLPHRGTKGVPESVTVLLEDAKWIKDKLLQIAEALEKEQ